MTKDKSFIPWWRIQYTETDVQSVAQAVRAEHISLGPVTAAFEKKLSEKLCVPYVVATTSGSMALLMTLIALGIGTGDEVIIPNRTWIAAAHAVNMLGAKVVLTDVLSHLPIIDVSQIEAKITSKTKAIIPAALSGRSINIDAIKILAKKYRLHVIEDAAQAIFSREKGEFAGTQADVGCFSFSVSKLIPTGQGGCIVTKDRHLYQELVKIRTHGVESLLDCVYNRFGFNCRFTDLQASIGLTQLEKVEQKITNINKIYYQYESGLKNNSKIHLIPVAVSEGEVPLYIEVLCAAREKLICFLQEQQIQVKSFYPNLNRATYLNCMANFPSANIFESQGITLPCGPDQSLENIKHVIKAMNIYEKNET